MNLEKDYTFQPYEVCTGRKYRFSKKLIRPLSIFYFAKICNENFSDKNKIRFIQQFFRWFIKDPTGFKLKGHFQLENISNNNNFKISEGDTIYVCCRSYKAAWKKLLSKLNFMLIDYKSLKRRKYCLNFCFNFIDLNKSCKEITLDIKSTRNDIYNIYITLNAFYIKSFEIFIENLKIWKKY
jgi:hypothetical protein